MVIAPPTMHYSAVSPCFQGCPAFLHRHFLSRSLPSPPLHPSLCSQQQPSSWDLFMLPKLPAAVPSRASSSLSGVCMAVARTVWFSFHLGCHSQLFHSQPSVFLLWLRQLPWCGDLTPASAPPPTKGRSGPTNTPVFPPSSLVLPSFAWFYIFSSAGQVLLSVLSWCSACTSVSEGIFLMYPWREMYSTFTYSSTILLSPILIWCPSSQKTSKETRSHLNISLFLLHSSHPFLSLLPHHHQCSPRLPSYLIGTFTDS